MGPAAAQDRSEPAVELVRRTVQNELNAQNGAKFMFRDQKDTPKGSTTRLMVETRDAMAGLTIARDGHPLSAEERRNERQRVERFVKSPDELRKKQKQERDDNERIGRIMKALPDAFLYQEAGTEPGTDRLGKAGHELIRLNFRPNPDYEPPTHVEQVLTGMKGYLLIDKQENRIAMIDGVLAQDVGFGWGFLGHLDRGGHFLVQQADVGEGHWEMVRMDLRFTGRVLLFKSINIQSKEVYSDFQPVPEDLSFAQGLQMLEKKQEAMLAQNGQAQEDAKD